MTQRAQPRRKGRTAVPPVEITPVEEKILDFLDTDAPPPEFDRIPKALHPDTPVIWVCSCDEMFAGADLEHTVHIHAAYSPGSHRVKGPIWRDRDAELTTLALWEAQDKEASDGS